MEEEKFINVYRDESPSVAFPALMRKVYLWMTMGLAMTGLAALYIASIPEWVQAVYGNKLVFWALIIGELGLVWYLSARIMRMSFATAGLLFAAYSLLNGVTLSYIFLAYEPTLIMTAFFVTAGMFGALTLLGFVIKKDLSGMGRFLMMALVGIIIASVVNIFLNSSTLYWAVTYLGVLLFSGLTVYDTQKLRMLFYQYGSEQNDGTMKLALLGSLTLYLDFINLFLFILRIFSGGNRN